MPDFSVRILSTPSGVKFDELSAPPGAGVTWDNTTNQKHQITYQTFSTNPIAPGDSSRPAYYIATDATGTITYYCTLHENESGTIAVTQVQPMEPEPDQE